MQNNERQFFEHLVDNYTPPQAVNIVKCYISATNVETIVTVKRMLKLCPTLLQMWLMFKTDKADSDPNYQEQRFNAKIHRQNIKLAQEQYNELAVRFGFPLCESKG